MALIERRIGLLFGASCPAADRRRARRVAGHRQGLEPRQRRGRPSRSPTPTLPARRGTIVDRHGIELAVSEPADDVSATPVPRQGPAAHRGAPRAAAGHDARGRWSRSSPAATPASSTSPASCPPTRPRPSASSTCPGIALTPGYSRFYPRHFLASQVLGSRRHRRHGPDRAWSTATTTRWRAPAAERRLVKDALGQSIEVRDTKPAKPGVKWS